jgi:hypothetical protein
LVERNQKFTRTELPKNFNFWPKSDRKDFATKEWDKRLNGYWFYNNGEVEYITGTNYLYCTWWWLDGQYPMYIDSDRDFFYVWKHSEKDPNCLGLFYITNRRDGKTFKGTCITFDRTAQTEEVQGGMQSKNNKDSGVVFRKLINSWRKLPDFFKPLDEGLSYPKSSLRFFEPSKIDKKNNEKFYEEALNSYIDFENAKEEAYDGLALYIYYMDEVGKTVEANVADRWNIVKECNMSGSMVVGKSLLSTTVEEMEVKGGKNAKIIWDDSALDKKGSNGRTPSGLIKYFKPADYGLRGTHPVTGEAFIDEFGRSNKDLMRSYILEERKNLEGEALKSHRRKYPLDEADMWQTAKGSTPFDADAIHLRKEQLLENSNHVRRVNFYRDIETGLVKWKDAPNEGRWKISWDYGSPEESNLFTYDDDGLKIPKNTIDFGAGADPFAHTIVTGKGSMGAAYVIRKLIDDDEENSGKAICRYYARPKLKSMMHEDLGMMCEYYGCKINYENNFDDYYEYFVSTGRKHYIMWRPKITINPTSKVKVQKYGTPSKDGFANARHLDILVAYSNQYTHKIDFIELLEDMEDYDPENRTPFDDTVAFGMALLGVMGNRMYKNTGGDEKKVKKLKVIAKGKLYNKN